MADYTAGAAAILDDDLLAKPVPEMLRNDPADDVIDATGRERHDEPHLPARVILSRRHG
jgi:NADPH:quinone reductase-like Zn-dependent oxidoreductase